MKAVILLVCLAVSAFSLKIFLIGGAASSASTQVFSALANVIPDRPAQPGKCD